MEIYGLVGPSGTGKSYKASNLANERGISYIIDDGLFIKGSKVIAGTSAKKEATMISAVRRALFMDREHALSVRKAIDRASPDAILVLGTSNRMLERIIDSLNLPTMKEIIQIEDIATAEEINIARTIRKKQGKHVIPVPTFEIRKDFSGYLLHPLRILRFTGKGRRIEALEKTVMRPTYSYMGKFFIADIALESIAAYNAHRVAGVYKATRVSSASYVGGVVIDIDITVYYGYRIHKVTEEIQANVSNNIVHLTGINVLQVNVFIKNIAINSN